MNVMMKMKTGPALKKAAATSQRSATAVKIRAAYASNGDMTGRS